MARRGFPWFSLLAVLVVIMNRSLDNPSLPAGNRATLTVLDEVPEQQDVDPGTTPFGHMELLIWSCIDLVLLVTGVSLSWWLHKRLRRCRREVKHQSPSASARMGCQGHDCCKEMIQLLKDNRALMQLCIRHLAAQRPGERRLRKWGIRNRKRRYLSPSSCLSSPALRL